MSLHIIYSNRYEVLKQCLIANLNQERKQNNDPVFSPLRVIVPGDVVTDDLTRAIADHPESKGLCTGIRMQQISRWMEPYGSLWLGSGDLGIELEWMIWRILLNKDFINKPTQTRLKKYFEGQQSESQRSARAYELAIRIAKVFTKYINYRYDWVLEWLLGKDALIAKKVILDSDRRQQELDQRDGLVDASWQAALWQEIKKTLQQDFADGAGEQSETLIDLLEGIPEKFAQSRAVADTEKASDSLHFFLPRILPPMALPFLAEESRKHDLWLYMINPCQEFWFEGVSQKLINNCSESFYGNQFLHRNASSTRALIDRIWQFAPDDGEVRLIEDDVQKANALQDMSKNWHPIPWSNLEKTTLRDYLIAKDGGTQQGIDQHMFYIERKVETLLDNIAGSILNDKPLEKLVFDPKKDKSLRIVKASGFVRQVEAVVDWIHAIQNLSENSLTAADILVVTPDIDKAAPLIEGVLDALPDKASIDYTIAGRSGLVSNMAAQGIISAGRLLFSNMGAANLVSLLAHPLTTASWNITLDDVQVIRRWLETAGFRYGLNQEHLDALKVIGKVGLEPDESDDTLTRASDGTLTRAVERLVLGYMMPERQYQPYGDVLPVYGTENSGFDRVADGGNRLTVLVNILNALDVSFKGMIVEENPEDKGNQGKVGGFADKSADDWYRWTLDFVERLFPNTPSQKDFADSLASFRQVLSKQVSLMPRSKKDFERDKDQDFERDKDQPKLPFDVFWQALENGLVENRDNIRGFGRVTFAGMQDFRWLPYKAIAMIGMDDGPVFPGVNRGEEFDLTLPIGISKEQLIKRRGDRDARGDNRNIFLDLLLAAQDYLLITYDAGSDPDSKTPLNPSIVVQDLIFWLKGAKVDTADIVTSLPLTRYSEGNLEKKLDENQKDHEQAVRFFRTFDERIVQTVKRAQIQHYYGHEDSFLMGAEPIGNLKNMTVLPFSDLESLWDRPDSYIQKKLRMADTEQIEQDRTPQLTMPDDRLFLSGVEKRMMEICRQGEEFGNLQKDPRFGSEDLREIQLKPIQDKVNKIYEASCALQIDEVPTQLQPIEVPLENQKLLIQIPVLGHCQANQYGSEGYVAVTMTSSGMKRAILQHLLVSASEKPMPFYMVSWDKDNATALIEQYQPCIREDALKVLTAICELYQAVISPKLIFPNFFLEGFNGGVSRPKFNPFWRHDEELQFSQNDLKKDIDSALMDAFFIKRVLQGKKPKETEPVTADELCVKIQQLMHTRQNEGGRK